MDISKSQLLLMLMMLPTIGLAQVVPDAGRLERETSKPLGDQELKKDKQPIRIPVPVKPVSGKNKLRVFVREFKFQGNTVFSNKKLGEILHAYVDQKLNFDQLNEAVRGIADFYRSHGRLVRTSLPKQDITDGVITIRVVEATFAGARITDGISAKRVSPNIITDVINSNTLVNKKLNLYDLERSVLLADDLPGVNVSGALSAGTRLGETVLQLSLSDEPLLSGKIGVDNFGSRATGSERLQIQLNFNSPSKTGDLLNFTVVNSKGSDYIQANYSLPVFLPGLRLGINAAYLDYRLVSNELKTLNAKGDFKSIGVNARYPLVRSLEKNLYIGLDFVHKKYTNDSLSIRQSEYSIDDLILRLTGNSRDKIAGGGINSANVAWTFGDVQQGQRDVAEDTELEGKFNKLILHISRLQNVATKTNLLASVTAQLGGQHLDSSERFYLGGVYDVRAYPNSEVSGSDGWRASLELRRRLPERFIASVFYDTGRAYTKNNSLDLSLKGAGAKLNWYNKKGWKTEAVFSRRIGSNPNPTVTGRDQDGSLEKNRLWLSVSWEH